MILNKRLRSEIRRSGFTINQVKTRLQYKDSRQDVTGLIVNKKANTKSEYWRTVRAQCHSLFTTGEFSETVNGEKILGNINSLEGRLNFIDHVDHYNRLRQKPPLNPKYQPKKEAIKHNNAKNRRYLHSGREDTFSKFLFYRLFYGNKQPTILTEGKTDNLYLKSAIHMLANRYPRLASPQSASSPYTLQLRFLEYTERTRYLLELHGGTDYLKDFIRHYKTHFNYYTAPNPVNPVIIFVDNDKGPKGLISYVNSINGKTIVPSSVSDIRKSNFVHIFHNLYLVLTPQGSGGCMTDIEYFFKAPDRLRQYKGKCFNTIANRNEDTDLSKDSFARHVVLPNKSNIDFSGFNALLDRIVEVIKHYDSIK